jgi:hypothetical protein
MKSFMLISLSLMSFAGFATTKMERCSLFVKDPVITHENYGSNTGPNKVNGGVLRILQTNGFSISLNESKARYTMKTEVRCGMLWTMFGPVDGCQTEVSFEDNKEEKLLYSSGPTVATPGLNINYDAISFPSCSQF